ncbi:MAG TPA: hypothetical protein PKD86_17670, partial [Gemmatales bacterium]|nr:hypothetical protein [Gemmatales bacterium]
YQHVAAQFNADRLTTVQIQYAHGLDQSMHIFLLWVRDPWLSPYYYAPPNNDLRDHLEERRQAAFMPFLFVPCYGVNPAVSLVHSRHAVGRVRWRVELSLTAARAVMEVKANSQFVQTVAAHRDVQGRLRFGLVAWENPSLLDWAFQADMSAAEYKEALAKRKQEGLRPVSVTSYDEEGTARYAASWVRYVTR